MFHSEEARRRALEKYTPVDADAEEALDRLVGMATRMLDVPVAVLGILDGDRCRLKAAPGTEVGDVPASESFAARVVAAGEPIIVSNPAEPFAEGEALEDASLCVYAGAPLVVETLPPAEEPVAIGALCVADTEPTTSEAEAVEALEALAATAVDALELRAARAQKPLVEDIGDAFFTLDAEWRFAYANRRVEELLERSREELIGQSVWEEFPEAVGSAFHEQYRKVLEEQATVHFEAYYEPLDTWFKVKAYPLEEGMAVYFDDATPRKKAEAALRKRKRQFQLLFRSNPLPMWVYDQDTLRFLAVNDAAIEHYGYSRDDFLSMRITDIRPTGEADRLVDYLKQDRPAFRKSGDWRHQRADGTVIDVEITSSDLAFDGQDATLVVAKDVTKQRAVEQALRERERYLSVTLDSIGDAVITTDAEGRVVRMNGVAEQLTGWIQSEAAGRPMVDIFHIVNAQTGEPVEDPVTKVLRQGKTVGLANHTALIARDGTQYQIADSAAPIRTDNGEVLGVVMVFQDVTEAYERREALRRSENLLSMALRVAQAGAWEWNLNTDVITWSDENYRVFGLEPGDCEASYDNWRDRLHPDDVADAERAVQDAIECEAHLDIAYRIVRPDGAVRWINAVGEIYVDDAAGTKRLIGFQRDITTRKEAEKALQQSEERYRTLVERSHDAIYIYRDNRLLFVNQRTCELTGYSESELLDIEIFELVHPDDRERIRRIARQRVDGAAPSRYEARLLRADGTVRHGEFSVQPITYQGEYAVIGSIRDVTERKEMEKVLRRRENKVQALYEAMGALTLTQTSERVAERIQALIVDTLHYSISAVRYVRDEKLVPVAVSDEGRRRMPERPDYEVEGEMLAARAFRAGDTVIYNDVHEIDTVHATGAVRAVAYVPVGPYGIISVGSTEVEGLNPFDVTLIEILARNAESVLERIEREEALREARDEAKEMNRLKSAFLANMSHEIRTPLTSIIGFAEVLGDQDLGTANELIRLIHRGGERLLDTLNSVLDLSQLEAGSMELAPERSDLVAEIQDTTALFLPQAHDKGVELATDVPDAPVDAHLDMAALRRILSNLLSNAVKFTRAGDRVDVRLRPARDHVTIEVEDTGIGIDEAFLPDLFDAFKQESTGNARAFEGSGLGLAITHQLVRLMNGDVQVASEKGEGTRFTVQLPRGRRAGD